MKLNAAIEKALNQQINLEIAAAYNYLAMTAHFEKMNLKGCAHWTRVQRQEELAHAMKIFEYVHDRDGQIVLAAVTQPKTDYQTVLEVFEAALAQEQANTEAINDLMTLARKHDDYATQSFLQWFIDEQVEEEKAVGEVVGLVTIAGDDRSALLVLNEQLARRATDT